MLLVRRTHFANVKRRMLTPVLGNMALCHKQEEWPTATGKGRDLLQSTMRYPDPYAEVADPEQVCIRCIASMRRVDRAIPIRLVDISYHSEVITHQMVRFRSFMSLAS